jgi:hypothetical protein
MAMSSDPNPNDAQNESTPLEPPTTANPLRGLVIPGILAVVIIVGIVFFVLPVFRAVEKTEQGLRKATRPMPQPYAPPSPYGP